MVRMILANTNIFEINTMHYRAEMQEQEVIKLLDVWRSN